MVSQDSLKKSMNMAVQHYSSLFRLPAHRKVLLLLGLMCMSCGLICVALFFPSLYGLLGGLCLGLTLFSLSLFADFFTSRFVLRKDTIFDLRRTIAVSFFCWGTWFFFALLGSFVAWGFGLTWFIRLCFLGFSAAIILRLLVFRSTTVLSYMRLLVSSFFQPFLCIAPFAIFFWNQSAFNSAPSVFGMLIFFPTALFVGVLAPFVFLSVLNKLGEKALGIGTLPLFRAFMLNWVLNLNAPFEELLEKLGEQRDITVSLLEFVTVKGDVDMIVPSVHPGPFKNIGSSILPSLLKFELEREFDSVVCVPHGLLGHEFDLASQTENRKIVANVATALRNSEVHEVMVSPFVTVRNDLATACCQIFGNSALISFTLAPKTIEDLPDELGFFVRQEAKRLGLDLCAVVNAHNSIDGNAEVPEFLDSLKDVGFRCLEKAATMERLPLSVGAATVLPREFTLEDGMGLGGITAVVVASGTQKAVYVVIDGNNMVSGLREKILSSLRSVGFDDGEIFTTDTHSVSALILGSRGYHAVGEVMDNQRLMNHIKAAVAKAEAGMERARFNSREITVSNVKVIGGGNLESLCVLIEKAIHRAKVSAVPVFAVSGLLLMILLLLV